MKLVEVIHLYGRETVSRVKITLQTSEIRTMRCIILFSFYGKSETTGGRVRSSRQTGICKTLQKEERFTEVCLPACNLPICGILNKRDFHLFARSESYQMIRINGEIRTNTFDFLRSFCIGRCVPSSFYFFPLFSTYGEINHG